MICSTSTSDRIKSQLNAYFYFYFSTTLPEPSFYVCMVGQDIRSVAAQAVKIEYSKTIRVWGGGASQMYRIESQIAPLSHPFLYKGGGLGFQHKKGLRTLLEVASCVGLEQPLGISMWVEYWLWRSRFGITLFQHCGEDV